MTLQSKDIYKYSYNAIRKQSFDPLTELRSGTMIRRLLPFVLFVNSLLIQRALSICPSEEFIRPCSCMTMAFGNHIVCEGINSTESLRDIFEILSPYDIHTLLLNSLRLDRETETLPANIFDGLKVQRLRFEDSVFQIQVGRENFQGLETHLQSLVVSNCNIAHLNDITFTHLVQLKEVTMNFDTMQLIKSDWFKDGPVSVQEVQLDHNMLGTIEGSAFLGLRNIRRLSLADNKLQTFTRNVLPGNAIKLTWIDLSYNKIEELPTDMFSNMPQLKTVVLTGNKLTSLPQSTWGVIWNRLDQLIIYSNPIVCDSELSWAIRERTPRHLNGSCQSPAELSGRHLGEITVDQLQSG